MTCTRTPMLVMAVAAVLLLTACSSGPSAAEQKQQCFANQTLISAEMKLFKADTGLDAPFADVVAKLHAVCPAGGKYSYDPATGVVSCSVHGHP